MGIRVLVPELVTQARGMRSMDVIVASSGGAFTKAILSMWESGRQPKDANKIKLAEALGVDYDKISLPIEKVPEDSKFFNQKVK